MRLSRLKKAIKKFARTKAKGKRLKAGKIRKTLDGLKQKQKKFQTSYAKEHSVEKRDKLKLKLRIVKAQIKKGQELLRNLDS